ncbi:MAG: nitroreductase family deazaflavin-dependent oxidoreductase [Candidatus Binatus sp.]
MLTAMPDAFQKESTLDRFFNRLMGRALRLGFAPGYMRLLEVRGRKSGKTFTTPVNVLDFNGRRWLVAARGDTAWARNARAAGHVCLRRGSSSESLVVRELADADKPEVIKAFLDRFKSQVQRFFDVPAGSPADAFLATASRTPVFELIAGA